MKATSPILVPSPLATWWMGVRDQDNYLCAKELRGLYQLSEKKRYQVEVWDAKPKVDAYEARVIYSNPYNDALQLEIEGYSETHFALGGNASRWILERFPHRPETIWFRMVEA